MAGHQTRVKKFCCIIPRQACHLVKLAVRHCARQVVILASHLLLVSRDPCLAVGAESDTSARTEGTGVEKYYGTILARGILLKEYLSLVFFASDWPSTDRRPLCTRTGALSLFVANWSSTSIVPSRNSGSSNSRSTSSSCNISSIASNNDHHCCQLIHTCCTKWQVERLTNTQKKLKQLYMTN